MKLHQEPSTVQIATLLTVIGAEARNVSSTFTSAYYQPLKNVPFERYKFYSRVQEGRKSHDHYRTTLRQLADRCEFETMTENKILQEKLVFGIQD